jgi:hypothetical protein
MLCLNISGYPQVTRLFWPAAAQYQYASPTATATALPPTGGAVPPSSGALALGAGALLVARGLLALRIVR